MSDPASIEAHYARSGQDIAERVLAALEPGAAVTPDALAPIDQFHGRGLSATKELAQLIQPQPGERLVDLGCGIGGPARWLAAHYGCHVSGIDLTAEFCLAARRLTEATGQTAQVEIAHGSALETPFEDESFDKAYSQNVLMNIADKPAFFCEAFRLLKPGGTLALAVVCRGLAGSPHYPVAWASREEDSFLSSQAATERDLRAAGFDLLTSKDVTDRAGANVAKAIRSLEENGPPALGPHIFMGERFVEFMKNGMLSRRDDRLTEIEVLARKPA